MAQGIGGAFLEFMPTLASNALSRLTADASKAGQTAGKSLGDNMAKSVESSSVSKMSTLGNKIGSALKSGMDKATKTLGDDLGKKFEDAGKKAQGGAKSFAAVGLAVGGTVTSLGALGPVLGGTVAALGPVVGGLAVLKTGMIAVKVTAAAVKFAAKDVGEAISAGLGDDPKKAAEALSKLPPAQKAVAKEAIAMAKSLEDVRKQAGEELFKPMIGGMQQLSGRIPEVTNKIPKLVGAVGEVGGKFAEAAAKGRLIDDVKGVMDNLTGSVKIAGTNVGLIPDAVGRLAAAWGRTLPVMGKGVDSLVVKITGMIKAWDEAGKIDKVLQGSLNQLKLFGQLLGNLGSIFANTFKNMEADGKGTLQFLVDLTGRMKEWVKSAEGQTKIQNAFKQMREAGDAMKAVLGPALKAIWEAMKQLAPVAGDMGGTFVTLLKAVTPLIPHFTNMATILIKSLIPPIQKLAEFLAENEGAAKALATGIGVLVAATKLYAVGVAAAGAASKAAAIAQALWSGALGKSTVATGTNTAAVVANKVALAASAAASKVATAATWLFNAALRANPIGIVVTAIAALVAAFVLLYKNNETVRKAVDAAWKAIKAAMAAVADWFVKTAWPALKTAFEAMGKAAEWLWKNAIVPAWNGIKAAIDVAWKAIKVIIDTFVTAYKGLETAANFLWKNVITPVWNGIKTVIEVAWTAIKVVFAIWLTQYVLIGKAAEFLWKNVIVPVWNGIKSAIETAWNFIKTNVLDAWQTYIKGPFTTMWNAFKTFFEGLWNGLKTFLSTTWNNIKTTVFDAWQTYIKGPFTTMWNLFKAAFELLWNTLKTFLTNTWNTIRTTIFDAWQTYIKGPFTAMWNAFKTFFTLLWNTLKTFLVTTWTAIKTTVFDAWQTYIKGPFTAMWNAFKTAFTVLWTAIKTMLVTTWTAIKTTVFDVWSNYIKGPFTQMWNTFKSWLTTLWNALKTMMQAAWNWIRDNVFTPIKNGIDDLKNKFQLWKTAIGVVWDQWKNNLKSGWDWVKTNVFSPMQTFITKTIPQAFTTGVNAVKAAWDKIEGIVKTPVRVVANTVLRDGLFKAYNSIASKVNAPQINWGGVSFKTGGVLPGYTPGRDVHQFVSPTGGRLELSGGEAIMRPEFTRVLGKSGVDTLNAAARSGGVAGVKQALGFAKGGIVSGPHGGPSKDRSTWSTVWEAVSGTFANGINPLSNVANALVKKIPAVGEFGGLLKNAVMSLVKSAASFIASFWGGGDGASSAGGGATPGEAGGPGGWSSMWNWVKQRFPSAELYSGYRNSYTLSGNRSLHASGRAIDITPNRAISDAIITNFGKNITELISPWPSDHYRHGKRHNYSHAIDAQHGVYGNNAHIHWAMRNGGIFDKGGILKPGKFAINAGRKPEAVLNPDESAGLKAMGLDTLADKLDEVVEAIDRVAPGVGAHIRGSGQGLISRSRSV